jgi:hypothetical protein
MKEQFGDKYSWDELRMFKSKFELILKSGQNDCFYNSGSSVMRCIFLYCFFTKEKIFDIGLPASKYINSIKI